MKIRKTYKAPACEIIALSTNVYIAESVPIGEDIENPEVRTSNIWMEKSDDEKEE